MRSVRTIVNSVVTLGPVGNYPFGGGIATILAIPFVYIIDMLVWSLPSLYPGIYILSLSVAALFLIFALFNGHEGRPLPSAIVINRIVGMLLVFSGIPLNIKFLITGLCFFLLMRYALPRLLARYAGIDCDTWPFLLSVLTIDCAAGLLVNFAFRFIFWLVTLPA